MSSGIPTDTHASSSNSAHQGIGVEGLACELEWIGEVQDQSTKFLVHWMEDRLEQLQAGALQRKRLIRVAIEMLQNLHHHAQQPVEGKSFAIYSNGSTAWTLQTRNRILPEQQGPLDARWNELKSMCQNSLRRAQRIRVAQEARSDHGGGGVGLNDMLRKSDGNAEMHFSHERTDVFVTFIAELPLYA